MRAAVTACLWERRRAGGTGRFLRACARGAAQLHRATVVAALARAAFCGDCMEDGLDLRPYICTRKGEDYPSALSRVARGPARWL